MRRPAGSSTPGRGSTRRSTPWRWRSSPTRRGPSTFPTSIPRVRSPSCDATLGWPSRPSAGDRRSARRDWRYDMVELGFNYRLTDIGSALGLAQLDRLPEFLRRRQEIAARYLAALEGHWAVQLPVVEPAATSAWHLFVVQLRLDRLTVDRGAIYRAMRAEGIGVNVHYIPVHRHSYYRDRLPGLDGTLPNAEAAYERLLTLPLFAGLSDADVEDVVAALDKVSTAYR